MASPSRAGAKVGFRWITPPRRIGEGVDSYTRGVLNTLDAGLEALATRILVYCQSEHPYQNVTGAAEAGFAVAVSGTGSNQFSRARRITVENREPDHGAGLEIWRDGRWGVIPDAIAAHQGELMAIARASLRGG